MEYSSGLSQTQVDEERAKIMDLVKVLEKDGKISVRQKAAAGFDVVEGMQEELLAMERRQKRFTEQRKRSEDIVKNKPSEAPAAAAPVAAPAPADVAQAQQ